MAQQNEANNFLMGGGVPSATFPSIGTTFAGVVASEPELVPIKDYATGKVKTWEDGNTQKQVVVILDTQERDVNDPQDDGKRKLYIKSGIRKALATAIRLSGSKVGIEVGGTIEVTYTGDGVAERGQRAPKEYSAVYTPPSAEVSLGAPVTAENTPAPATGLPEGFDPSKLTPEALAALAQITGAQK